MEPIFKGWLVKSPPEQKSSGPWKLFGAKWKRRYFVLYAPPTSCGMIGARAAMLEYYSSKKLSTKVGCINLEDCNEVLSNLDSDTYKNVFGLQTKHKGRERTYYLVADNEDEMNGWVAYLCNVLGLLENDENKLQYFPESKMVKSASGPTLPRPIPNFQTHPSAMKVSPPQNCTLPLSSRFNSSESNLLDNKLFSPTKNLENEIKSKPFGSVPELESLNISSAVLIKPREKMELPPIPPEKFRKSLEDIIGASHRSESKNSVLVSNLLVEECLGPPPPKPSKEKKKNLSTQSSNASDVVCVAEENYNVPKLLTCPEDLGSYDSPKNYNQKVDGNDRNENDGGEILYNTPKSSDFSSPELPAKSKSSETLKAPPVPVSRKSMLNKNFKSIQPRSIDGDTEFCYSVPTGGFISNSHLPTEEITGFTCVQDSSSGFYSVPQDSSNSFYSVPQDSGASFYSVPQDINSVYSVPPSKKQDPCDIPCTNGQVAAQQPVIGRRAEKHQKLQNQPAREFEENDCMYDAPKNVKNDVYKPVPAKRTRILSKESSSSQQPIVKQPSLKPIPAAKPVINKESIRGDEDQRHIFKKKVEEHSPRGKGQLKVVASFQKKLSPTNTIHDSIRFTQRSKSFRRNVDGPDDRKIEMPVKRITERMESSDDCDSGEDEC